MVTFPLISSSVFYTLGCVLSEGAGVVGIIVLVFSVGGRWIALSWDACSGVGGVLFLGLFF